MDSFGNNRFSELKKVHIILEIFCFSVEKKKACFFDNFDYSVWVKKKNRAWFVDNFDNIKFSSKVFMDNSGNIPFLSEKQYLLKILAIFRFLG